MADNNDLQILVKDILEGVGSMLDQHKKETLEEIRASENRTRMLIEAQDKKISAIAEQVGSLGNRMGKVENRLDKIENRLDTLESDVKVVKDLAVDYVVDLTPHWFRHNYITLLYDAGVDAVTAMRLVGHTDYQTTVNVYTHIKTERLKESALKLETVFSQKVADKLPGRK